MDNQELERYFTRSTILQEPTEDPEVLVNLAGYQVTKAELFAHSREPAITIWENRIKFNMACLRRFPGVTHIQILIHPVQKRLIIRPCSPDAPDSLRWSRGGGSKEISNRDLLCKIFAAKVFDLMGWDPQYRYKMMGNPAVCDGEMLFLFRLTDFELFTSGKKSKSYLPGDWRDYFGTPVEQHEESFKIDLADGYITTDKT
ncbi:MAG: hypothetical protein IJI45_04835 [Anaerolineaceae bacterium]|nr:integrase [Oscillospiraceae bacterium]MBQ6480421.1 hypothetical protein [Anaerolineaceae bacterium]